MSNHKETIIAKLESIEQLPSLPEVVTRLTEILQNEDSSAADVAKVLSDDPAIMARVLKVSNSSFYNRGDGKALDSIDMATVRLGYKMISDIAISTSVFSIFPKEKDQKSLDRKAFWKHCIYVGLVSKAIIKLSAKKKWDFNIDKVTLAGLLHNIGIIVMEEYFNDFFVQILNYATNKNLPILAVEKAVLGIQHAEIGAWLANKWNIDEDLVACIEFYHEPKNAPEAHQQFCLLLAAAKHICITHRLGNSGTSSPFMIEDNTWEELGIEESQIPKIIEVAEEASALSELLNIV